MDGIFTDAMTLLETTELALLLHGMKELVGHLQVLRRDLQKVAEKHGYCVDIDIDGNITIKKKEEAGPQ